MRAAVLLLCSLINFIALSSSGIEAHSQETKREDLQQQAFAKIVFILIDFKSFQCHTCLESFLEFNHDLKLKKTYLHGSLLLAFLTSDSISDEENKVLRKQVKGFREANDIPYPIMIDTINIFDGPRNDFTGIIIVDNVQKLQKRWTFPLTIAEKKEFFDFFERK